MPLNAERIESSLAVGAKDVGVRSLDIGVASVGVSVTKDAVVATTEGSVFTDVVYDVAEGASEVIVKDGAASVVHTRNKTQGNASGVAEMSSSNLNFKSADNINCKASVVHTLGFGVTQSTLSDHGVFVKGLCTNVNVTDRQFTPSDIAVKSVIVSGANEDCSSSEGDGKISASVGGARTYITKGWKKRKRRLSRNRDRRPGGDMKKTSFNHTDYRSAQGAILSSNQDSVTLPIARSHLNQGHSPTKAEVKKMNQRLIDDNHRLKNDFHKADHRLKTLLANKKDLLHQLRLESKATNKLIKSIQDEAHDTMERSRDILSEANRSKKDAEILKDDIETSRNTLLGVRMDIKKQYAQLK